MIFLLRTSGQLIQKVARLGLKAPPIDFQSNLTSPPKKKLLWLLPGLFYLSVGRSRFVWDGSPRGLFDVKDEPFEVFAFRMVDVDRVVGRLGELVQNTDVATGNGCCGEYGHAELFPIDGL